MVDWTPLEEGGRSRLTVGQQEHFIKEVKDLWLWLKEGHHDCGLLQVDEVAHALHDEEGGGAVKAGRYLIQEERCLGPHDHLACMQQED